MGSKSSIEIDPDLAQVERAFRRIQDPHTRYFLAQLIELAAEGIEANAQKARIQADKFTEKRRVSEGE